MLVNIPKLVMAYYTGLPDFSVPAPAPVAVGIQCVCWLRHSVPVLPFLLERVRFFLVAAALAFVLVFAVPAG